MIGSHKYLTQLSVLPVTLWLLTSAHVQAQTAQVRYTEIQAREQVVRRALEQSPDPENAKSVSTDARRVIASYEAFVGRFPVSGYSDNALFNAAAIADLLYRQLGEARDRQAALRLYQRLASEYPSSSLIKQSEPAIARLETEAKPATVPAPAGTPASNQQGAVAVPAGQNVRAKLTSIERVVVSNTVRVTLSLDREVAYREETLDGPARIFFDLKGVEAAPELRDAVLRYPSQIVRQIRIGRHPESTVRVVLDLEGVGSYSTYTLYNPFRLVIDCEPAASTAPQSPEQPAQPARVAAAMPPAPAPPPPGALEPRDPPAPTAEGKQPVPARETTPLVAAPPAPTPPRANSAGGFSIARQLGLGVSRIVIDPGHGGRDPGAQGKDLSEAELTLDIALRLEKLLAKEPGVEVVLTRRADEYIALEERTAIANREAADLFLSIHANASRSSVARGVETYFLSFASSPEAEAVAARENSTHEGEMRKLPDIIEQSRSITSWTSHAIWPAWCKRHL
jgi:N-acetylmuramoyl-L-alanine amidase